MDLRCCVGCFLFLAMSNFAKSDEPAAPVASKPQDSELVIGDSYDIKVTLAGDDVQFAKRGRLVKATKKWLAFGGVRPASTGKEYLILTWFPRDAANLSHRGAYQGTDRLVPIFDEFPRTNADVGFLTVSDGHGGFSQRAVKVVGVKDEDLVLDKELIPLSSVVCVHTRKPLVEPKK